MTKVIAVSNNKGGTGKSSLASNLAGMLAEDYPKVLMIDLDGQANLSLSFGKSSKSFDLHIYDVLIKDAPVGLAIYNIMDNLDIIPSSSDMDNFDFEVLLNSENYSNFFKILDSKIAEIKQQYNYDYIILDCPPSLSLSTLNALSTADFVLIPTGLDAYSIAGLNSILTAVAKMQTNNNPKLQIAGVIPSIVDLRTNLAKDILYSMKDYLESLDITLFDSAIPKSVASSSSVAYNSLPITLNSHMKRNSVAKAYRALYTEIMEVVD